MGEQQLVVMLTEAEILKQQRADILPVLLLSSIPLATVTAVGGCLYA
jgi:hypothetical protein